jgi:hypothetical protein
MERPEGAADRPPRRRFQHRLFGSPGGAGEPVAGDRDADRAAGCQALAERLVRLLAERSDDPEGEPAAVLVAGSDPDAIAAALAAAGHRVSALAPPGRPVEAASGPAAAAPERLTGDLLDPGDPPHPGGRDGAGAGYDAVVLLEPAQPGHLLCDRARALLADGGLLLIAGAVEGEAGEGISARLLEVALAETGLLAGDSEAVAEAATVAPGGYRLWSARRDRFAVRGYRAGDEAGILELFRASFHVERSRRRWAWEYLESPYGGPAISLAVDEQGAIVAHYAGYPVRFRRTDPDGAALRWPALQVGDTMTSPAARGVGRGATTLLARTVRHFYAAHCRGRVAFNYGFNTGKIQRFSMRSVGALRVGPVAYRRLDLDPDGGPPAALRRGGGGLFGGWRVEPVTSFDQRFDRLFEAAAAAYGTLVERDARYLGWRYGACPEAVGGTYRAWAVYRRRRLAGWGVFVRRDDRLVWGDALFDPERPEAPRRLLGAVLADPENLGVTAVEGWFSAHPRWWDAWVAELGFESQPEPQGLGMVYVPFEHDPGDDFRRGLYVTMGDSDLF